MKQKTIKVNGEKIKIRARAITRARNFCGYSVKINDKEYRIFNTLYIQEAMNTAFVKYVKELK